MALFQPRVDIHSLSTEARASLQPGQHIMAGIDGPKGVYLGQKRGGSDVAAWSENAKGHKLGYSGYLSALRAYAKN